MSEDVGGKLDLFIELQKASTLAVIDQTRVLNDIKVSLNTQNANIEKLHNKLEVEVVKKITKLEFASKIHWFIVGGGFLGIIISLLKSV